MKYDIEALMKKWQPPRTGNYKKDCATGREIAEALMCNQGSPSDLGWIVRSMVTAGKFDGVEVGFFHRISELAA